MKTYDVIYVPGLGDSNPKGQRLLVSSWRVWGVEPHFFQMNWSDGEAFAPKLERLLALIDELHSKEHQVFLVGASAAAGAVINAFVARKDKVSGVVCICGKVNNPAAIGGSYRRKNPAFVESSELAPESLAELESSGQLDRIISRYALFDPVIPRRDSIIQGARNHKVLTIGHATTIATQLLFGAPLFLRFLKKSARVIK